MSILTQFILRTSFGLALAMSITSPREVTSGYYRNHLYVLFGLNTLATLIAWTEPEQFPLWPPLAIAVLSYVGSVVWLYEKPRPGVVVLVLVALLAVAGAWLAADPPPSREDPAAYILWLLDPVTGGLVLGVTLAAMFLGHWYLNTPTMVLAPLNRLVLMMAAAIVARMGVCAAGLVLEISRTGWPNVQQALFLLLRWLAGLFGALVVAWMTRQTLKIPNTQSATGLLYVGVIVTFLGELMALLLSENSAFPL